MDKLIEMLKERLLELYMVEEETFEYEGRPNCGLGGCGGDCNSSCLNSCTGGCSGECANSCNGGCSGSNQYL